MKIRDASQTASDPSPLAPDSSVAVYVHIPWCASLCPYCDFDKQASDFRLVDAYIDGSLSDVRLSRVRSKDRPDDRLRPGEAALLRFLRALPAPKHLAA